MSAIRTLGRRLAWLTLVVAFYAGLMLAYWLSLLGPLQDRRSSATVSLERMRHDIQKLEVVGAKLTDFEKEVGHLEDRIQWLDRRLPTSPALQRLRVELDERAARDGVHIERLEAADPIYPGQFHQSIGLEIEARGNLAALGRFVAGLWRTPRLLSVSGASMQRAPERGFLLTLEAETYVLKPEADETHSTAAAD